MKYVLYGIIVSSLSLTLAAMFDGKQKRSPNSSIIQACEKTEGQSFSGPLSKGITHELKKMKHSNPEKYQTLTTQAAYIHKHTSNNHKG